MLFNSCHASERKSQKRENDDVWTIRYPLQTTSNLSKKIQLSPFNHREECVCFWKSLQANAVNKRTEPLSCLEVFTRLKALLPIEQLCYCCTAENKKKKKSLHPDVACLFLISILSGYESQFTLLVNSNKNLCKPTSQKYDVSVIHSRRKNCFFKLQNYEG